MEIEVTTPALLFPAISLLLLAYTNRFLVIAARIRDLHSRYRSHSEDDAAVALQIENLRKRVGLIRAMQALGILSLLLCVVCMFVLFAGQNLLGKLIFGASLLLLMASLSISLWEIQISTVAISLELQDFQNDRDRASK